MGNEIDKLQQAKMFMDYLANGIDPVSNTDADAETLRNEQVIACFRYISDLLEKKIQQNNLDKKYGRKAVYITDEQRSKLQVQDNCKVSEIANEINRVIAENDTRRFRASWINDWLEANGYLCRNSLGNRIATETGEKLGITSKPKKRNIDGDVEQYYINFYSAEAQNYIFQHIDEILAFRYGGKTSISINFHNVDFPLDLSISEFVKQYSDKCFIISVGSCDSFQNNGSYATVLLYKGRRKILRKNNIPINSVNQCILYGIMEAASAIKSPTDILILTSTSLGFNSPKSKNYQLCNDIMVALAEKECNISISVCRGKGEELYRFVNALG